MRISRLLSLLITALLVVPVLATAGATATSSAATVPTLVGIRAAHHPGVDRIVFVFDGGLPATRQVRYVDQLLADGSGLPVRIAGRAILRVRFDQATAHDADGATVTGRQAFATPNIITAVRAGDFEAVTTYGIGLAKRTAFEVSTLRNPDRVVIDIGAAFPTVDRKVFFFDQERYLANTEPFFVPRVRQVREVAQATAVLDRLYAGPLPREWADGLRLLRSRSTGFTDLDIGNRIARVQLTGRCSSGGSTVTVAGEIMPTLRQFTLVDWVKIYDPAGTTLTPFGPTDSVPECLEP